MTTSSEREERRLPPAGRFQPSKGVPVAGDPRTLLNEISSALPVYREAIGTQIFGTRQPAAGL